MTQMMDVPIRFRRLMFLFVLVAGMVVTGSSAHACSCAPPELDESVADADGAFVGRWVDRSEIGDGLAAVTFEVERVIKGSFGPRAIVRTNAQGSACGLELLDEPRTGLLLREAPDDVWESELCSMVAPSALLTVGGDHPPDPAIAPIGAGSEPGTIVWLVGAMIVVAIVALLWARWRASSDGIT